LDDALPSTYTRAKIGRAKIPRRNAGLFIDYSRCDRRPIGSFLALVYSRSTFGKELSVSATLGARDACLRASLSRSMITARDKYRRFV